MGPVVSVGKRIHQIGVVCHRGIPGTGTERTKRRQSVEVKLRLLCKHCFAMNNRV